MMTSAVTRHEALGSYVPERQRSSRPYQDLHEHVVTLAEKGLLYVVDQPVNKDTEMHPLVRWQYRGGLNEDQRKAFLFTRPTDGTGRSYLGAVLVGGLAANNAIYQIGFGHKLEQIGEAWRSAIAAPIAPQVVSDAACHEVVTTGGKLDRPGGGLEALPVPISTPGWDNAPYLSAGHYITKDPDTGVQNVGTYRGQIKSKRRLGMNASVDFRQGIYLHWLKYKSRREPMPACVVVGCPP